MTFLLNFKDVVVFWPFNWVRIWRLLFLANIDSRDYILVTSYKLWVQNGLFRRLPIRGTIFSEALNSEDFLCNSVLWKQNSSIVRYFTKGTSVTRSPVITKTGWLKCQWCGASPLLDDSPLLGCRGRIWETYIILTQMGCKSICDARVETTVSSLYIAAWPQPCCKGYNRRWHTLSTLNYLYRRSAYEV